MQAGKRDAAAPVAAVEGVAAAQEQGTGYRAAPLPGQHQQDAIAQVAPDVLEEGGVKNGNVAVGEKSVTVEALESQPVGAAGVGAVQPFELDPGFADATPFLAQIFSLFGAEGGQKVVEVPIAAVLPMELAAVAKHIARLCE